MWDLVTLRVQITFLHPRSAYPGFELTYFEPASCSAHETAHWNEPIKAHLVTIVFTQVALCRKEKKI